MVLGPGDVYLNLDFGYQPDGTENSADIGDTIYLDANADNTQGTGETGISGVTVALLNSNDEVIATTTTDENGNYLFPSLPCLLYTSPSPRDKRQSRMPSSA